ncbi:hypothetical protein ABZW30_08340 [Kitasatospora sp. NPDC004669]|uniref:hypothetical protein n=1 Tax=Kitasatospora sp. NPDC004669 TaxID=3154555 RepID=UPI0033AAE0EC
MNGTDDATETNTVSIRREADGRIVAVGGDESAPLMLQIRPRSSTTAASRPLLTTAPVQRYRSDLHSACLPHLTTAPVTIPVADRAQAARASSPAAWAAGASTPVISAPPAAQANSAASSPTVPARAGR